MKPLLTINVDFDNNKKIISKVFKFVKASKML